MSLCCVDLHRFFCLLIALLSLFKWLGIGVSVLMCCCMATWCKQQLTLLLACNRWQLWVSYSLHTLMLQRLRCILEQLCLYYQGYQGIQHSYADNLHYIFTVSWIDYNPRASPLVPSIWPWLEILDEVQQS